jgi:hypothetical protein
MISPVGAALIGELRRSSHARAPASQKERVLWESIFTRSVQQPRATGLYEEYCKIESLIR